MNKSLSFRFRPKKIRSVINGKALLPYLPKFSDRLTLSQPVGLVADYVHPLTVHHLKNFRDYTPENLYE